MFSEVFNCENYLSISFLPPWKGEIRVSSFANDAHFKSISSTKQFTQKSEEIKFKIPFVPLQKKNSSSLATPHFEYKLQFISTGKKSELMYF